jgi:hypothetical protein
MLIMFKISSTKLDICLHKINIKVLKLKLKKFKNKELSNLIVQQFQLKKCKEIII